MTIRSGLAAAMRSSSASPSNGGTARTIAVVVPTGLTERSHFAVPSRYSRSRRFASASASAS
jgi:hypothetical protein